MTKFESKCARQDKKYSKKYKPVKTGAVKGLTKGEWIVKKQQKGKKSAA